MVERKTSLSMAKKLKLVREKMKVTGLDALIVPTGDAHNCETPPDNTKRREYITGFTGSAGTAIILIDKALMWTDGRYFLQAEQELELNYWTLMKDGLPSTPKISEYLKQDSKLQQIGYDPLTVTITFHKTLIEAFEQTVPQKKIILLEHNLIDEIWENDGRPSPPFSNIFSLDHKYHGMDTSEKLKKIRKAMETENIDVCITAQLDDVAWVTNLRAHDIMYTPVFLSYFVIESKTGALYVDEKKLQPELISKLNSFDIQIKPYTSILTEISHNYGVGNQKIWMNGCTNCAIYNCIQNHKTRVLIKTNPMTTMKAIKNTIELEKIIEIHKKDAWAKICFLVWLDSLVKNPTERAKHTEYTLAQTLDTFRALWDDNDGPSFPTISGLEENSAVIHYRPYKVTAKPLSSNDLYLVDSGGQYFGGTTDVTRTVHLGNPSSEHQTIYTLVLKGHIALRQQVFPKTTKGSDLDVLARMFLWNNGRNYAHGTGHGVGSYLNVHEGPQYIGSSKNPNECSLEPGMVLSNEPGCYLDGKFGVRIENLIYVDQTTSPKLEDYYQFKDLTLIPYCKKLIKVDMLTEKEIEFINNYHCCVYNEMNSFTMLNKYKQNLVNKDEVLRWLKTETSPLSK